MTRRNLVFTSLGLLAVAGGALAARVESGLKPGAQVGAFQVVDVSGPNKGKQLCYRCSYGGSPVVAAFIKGDAKEASNLVAGLQKMTTKFQDKGLRSFVVFMGGPELKARIEKLAAEKKVTIPLTFLPQGASADDVAAYKISPTADSTILLWRDGTVRANLVNVSKDQWDEVVKAAETMLR